MKTIALRFSDKFAPECGTIKAHMELIQKNGYVWYGKLGNKVANSVFPLVLENGEPRILLIHSGQAGRYWAYIDMIQYEIPNREDIPAYYRNEAEKFKTWFRVNKIETAPRDIMNKCRVISSGQELGVASRYSMSPYYKIIAPDK